MNAKLLKPIHKMFEDASTRANKRIDGDDVERRWGNMVAKDGGYKCIHLNPEHFFRSLSAVMTNENIDEEKAHKLTFVDVGCGVGEKVYFAEILGFRSFGLELREPLLVEARKLYRTLGVDVNVRHHSSNGYALKTEHRFIQGDALEHDYSRYDVIYFYCPLADGKLQIKLEERIAKTAKAGAIVIGFWAKGCFSGSIKEIPEGWEQRTPARRELYFVKQTLSYVI